MLAVLTPTLSNPEIAAFSRPEIHGMDNDDLVSVVRSAALPFLKATDLARLPQMGRESLLRLVFLAREYCRNQSENPRWSALGE